ncbi:hypothetical protein [Robiginitalea marina]|uniref:Periplasmic heavy metal sensor n=1 Tax=Robiginitalea marina TaxID=2954105 RepID=A0ABT1AWR8_9FLAO|nr:hypothetical protein [Robiginitalea marina]MCO5724047.1 hypothetical protein [Robiginitalea marina]
MKAGRFLHVLFVFFAMNAFAQEDCALGLGGADPNQIIEAFELDPVQQEKLLSWVEALKEENAPLQQKLDSLLAAHPQKTPEDLTALGQKYEVIKGRMVGNSARYDRLLLGILRPSQYRVYESLCRQVGRLPLEPVTREMLEAPEEKH